MFASVIGTAHLLSPEERELWRGFMINRFRGDVTLFDAGVPILESWTGTRCFGVFPFADDIHLDAEDGLALSTDRRSPIPPGTRLAIVRLPCLSNATDFRLLTWADWLTGPGAGQYDSVVVPGTKKTIDDLQWLRSVGLADWIIEQNRGGATVIGICGSFQMMGTSIADPHGVEKRQRTCGGPAPVSCRNRPDPRKANAHGVGHPCERTWLWCVRNSLSGNLERLNRIIEDFACTCGIPQTSDSGG